MGGLIDGEAFCELSLMAAGKTCHDGVEAIGNRRPKVTIRRSAG